MPPPPPVVARGRLLEIIVAAETKSNVNNVRTEKNRTELDRRLSSGDSRMNSNTRDLLPVYWSRLFPFEAMYEWLNYGEEKLFAKREFVLNFGDGDRFLRNLSFDSVEALKAFIKKEKPNKIDIGAVYLLPPKSAKGQAGQQQRATQKELVLDIDLTDYDQVRNCCSAANICAKCWKYVILAIKILDTALREDFGYEHILWVFSGRRGVHAWVCDKNARSLSSQARLSICNYLQLIQGGDYVIKRVHLGNEKICSSIRRALGFIDEIFVDLCVVEQDMLGSEGNLEKFLGLLHQEFRTPIKEYLERYPTSLLRWNAFLKIFNKNKRTMIIKEWIECPYLIEEIKIQYAYPRIDLQVTYGLNHLLKAPFSIHPKTGIMGVPIDHTKIDQFNPLSLPTISNLLDQIDSYCELAKEIYGEEAGKDVAKSTLDLSKTSLEDHYQVFCKFLDRLKLDQTDM